MRLRPWSPILILLVLSTCGDDEEQAPPTLPLDQVLTDGQTRAGVITKDSELIGGQTAKGRVGDVKLYNSRVAFIIADIGRGDGFNPYGGDIIDADRARPSGEGGRSSFGEILVGLELGTLAAERIEIVNDGADGQAAVVRVVGRLGAIPLFDAVLGNLVETKRPDVEVSIDYVLEPDAQWLRIEWGVLNDAQTNVTVEFGVPLIAFLFGEAVGFLPGYGFVGEKSGPALDYYAAFTEDVSYLYCFPDQVITTIFTDPGTSVATLGERFNVRAKEKITFSHYLIVGDGDVSHTQALWRELIGAPPGVAVEGTVSGESGQPVPFARVHATKPGATNDSGYVTRTRADESGRFRLEVEKGDYELVAIGPGRVMSSSVTVTVDQSPAPIQLELESPGTVAYEIKDERGQLLPTKLTFVATRDGIARPLEVFGEAVEPGGVALTEYGIRGTGTVDLAPGAYRLYVSRGGEYEVLQQEITIGSGETVRLEKTLRRTLDTTGWMSTDTHIHAQLSNDSPDLYTFKVSALVVEGIELPVSTEHEVIGDFNPAIESLGLSQWMKGVIGSEISTLSYGHFNGFPLVQDFDKPGNGAIQWLGKPPAETFAAIRANPGDPYLQVNHPRATGWKGYFTATDFDRDTFETRSTEFSYDFDGIEVANGCGTGQIDNEVQDWFAFLNKGMKKFATGSTDSHVAHTGELGFPRTYVEMPTDEPAEASMDDFRAATKAGRMMVSCGPFIQMRIDGKGMGETVAVSGTFSVEAKVSAPLWIDVDTVDVIVNGEIVDTLNLTTTDAVERFAGNIQVNVPAGQDAWIVLLARGDAHHGVFADNEPSWGITNPIFLDGDQNGEWKMP